MRSKTDQSVESHDAPARAPGAILVRSMANVAGRVLWFAGVPLAALAGGYLGFFPVFTIGLVVPIYLVGPLAVLTGALLATLFAGWLANLASRGESRSRLLAALAISVVGAVLGLVASALLGRALYAFAPFAALWPANAVWAACSLVFAAATSTAVWRLRKSSPPGYGGATLGVAGAMALVLSLAWAVMLPLNEGMAYQLGLVGAGFGPVIPLKAILWVSLAMAAAGTAMLARTSRRGTSAPPGGDGGSLERDAALTLLLTGLAPALVVGVIGLGCAVTYCGA